MSVTSKTFVSRIGVSVPLDALMRQCRYIVFILEHVLQKQGNFILCAQHLENKLDFESPLVSSNLVVQA